jgi:hypothetical protein
MMLNPVLDRRGLRGDRVGLATATAFAEMAALTIGAHGEATYFGTPLQETSLVTDADAVIAGSRSPTG